MFNQQHNLVESILRLGERFVSAVENPRNVSSNGVPVASDATPKLTVETIDNHIYFYADVDSDRCLAMTRTVKELDSRLRNERYSRNLPPEILPSPIWLHIQSGGGSLFAGMAAANQLEQIQTPVYSIVEGYCASAATVISLACKKRFIMPNAYMLIHQLSSMAWGTYSQIKDNQRLLDMLMDDLVSFYAQKTKLKPKQLKEILAHDTWFDSALALESGLADVIYK